MKQKFPNLILQFKPDDIATYAARYAFADDKGALEAGQAIAAGEYDPNHLKTIFVWKTKGRGISRLMSNTSAEIADTLRLSVAAKSERAALAVLLGLRGVDVPVGTAVLTAIDPKKFTVIDFRALEALGTDTTNRSIDFYLAYLAVCRTLAMTNSVTLRDLDRALWQWSREHGKSI